MCKESDRNDTPERHEEEEKRREREGKSHVRREFNVSKKSEEEEEVGLYDSKQREKERRNKTTLETKNGIQSIQSINTRSEDVTSSQVKEDSDFLSLSLPQTVVSFLTLRKLCDEEAAGSQVKRW